MATVIVVTSKTPWLGGGEPCNLCHANFKARSEFIERNRFYA